MIYSENNKPLSGDSVGNKAFYLYRIAAICNVPKFITVGTDSFAEILSLSENREIKDSITQIFLNKLGIVHKMKDVQEMIGKMYIPGEFIENLKKELADNGVLPPYAVRSSSTMEDGNQKSGAGIYESYCDVTDDELLERIKDCWKSNFTVRSLCYENANDDVEKRIASMGVIVQHFVNNAGIAGVFFSVDPVYPENGAVAEYVEGTAEELMAGSRLPVTVQLGFFKEDIPEEQYKFEGAWMYELLRYGSGLAKEIGCNVDVEWVFADGHVSIIQCRPITAVSEVSDSKWLLPVSKAASVPENERSGLADYIVHLQKKKIPFYTQCEANDIPVIGWFFVRYGADSDIDGLADKIVGACGKGFYAIMLNKIILDFQCDDGHLAEMLKGILELTGQDCLTVSVKYIPHNEMSCISYYNSSDESVRIEAVPGTMKGIKSGYLKPTVFILDRDNNIVFSTREHYTSYYDIDLITNQFIEPKTDMYIYEDILKHVRMIADDTRKLHNSNIIGDIEWWVCDGKLYATDYSIEKRREGEDKPADLRRISSGDIRGNIFMPGADLLAELEDLSYGCSISADEYDERVNELEIISRMFKIIDAYKAKYGKCILAVPRPLLGLSPVLDRVDGVIFESASRLCHLSVIIREKKIPAIELGGEFAELEDGRFVEYI